MSLTLITHPSGLAHVMGRRHPEGPDRLRAVLRTLDEAPFAECPRIEAPAATREQLLRVHTSDYLDRLCELSPDEGLVAIDPDTYLSPATVAAATRAAGAVCAAVDTVTGTDHARAFCAVRPPGHHAEPNQALGFCFFNNVAVGALHALETRGAERVAIVDFDVHHGNGTETVAAADGRIAYFSTHQAPLFPGTASLPSDRNHVHDRPLPAGTGSEAFREAWRGELLPALDRWAPDLLFISAGFDADQRDPLAQLALETADYAWLTGELSAIAERHGRGRIVSTLEGGYDLKALGEGVTAHLQALMPAR